MYLFLQKFLYGKGKKNPHRKVALRSVQAVGHGKERRAGTTQMNNGCPALGQQDLADTV